VTLVPVRVMGAGVVSILCAKVNLLCAISDFVIMSFLVTCPPHALPNGVINCSMGDDGVYYYKDTCSFTCNTGYELTGSDNRTCLSNGSWDGTNNVCKQGVCACACACVFGQVVKALV